MAKFSLTNKAVEDLSEIWDYTYETWSENQAVAYYEMLIETCKEISKSPDLGRGYPEISKQILGFRVGKHIIFYRVMKAQEIEIVRILHGKMDLKKRMSD